jgi:hypothetical protein
MAAALRAAIAPPVAVARSSRGPLLATAAAVLIGLAGVSIGLQLLANKDPEPQAANQSNASTVLQGHGPPELRILVQRKAEAAETKTFSEGDPPLETGDRVQLHVQLERPAYLYLYWFDGEGSPDRLWPPAEKPLDNQQKIKELWHPPGAEQTGLSKFVTVTGSPGIEMAVATISDRPLSADELAEFESREPLLEGTLTRYKRFVEYSHPKWNPARRRDRGLSSTPVVSGKSVSADIDGALSRRFQAYHGVLFYHQ